MMVGTATFKIVLSSTMMNSELDKMTRAIQRFGSAGWSVAAPHPAPGAVVSDIGVQRIGRAGCR
jgi:hypothetical protein